MAQDIPTFCFVWDNASTDGTLEYLHDEAISHHRSETNQGVSKGWNWSLDYLFETLKCDYVLVANNDIVLPSWIYRRLLWFNVPFVTGVSVDNLDTISREPDPTALTPGPDFSLFLIRRYAWDIIGPFNESMKLYASDNDFHARAHRAGIQLFNANIPFYHDRSSTMKSCNPKERRILELQADADREVFKTIYGCQPWEPAYHELFK